MSPKKTNNVSTLILGAGITGLAAGIKSGGTVLEQHAVAGGICSSYYRATGAGTYRFENGGGHWIFGGDQQIHEWIAKLSPCISYQRDSAVFFPDRDLYVPYPLQNYLARLGEATAQSALAEIEAPASTAPAKTMRDWLLQAFGRHLCELFFFPFHEAYTAGLYSRIAPQDPHKSPVDIEAVRRGIRCPSEPAGYNITFCYPRRGLDHLVAEMSGLCSLHPGCEVTAIYPEQRRVFLASGESFGYERLITTLPLHTSMALAGLELDSRSDPFTSVLVLNIGATAGPRCPSHHWLYIPRTAAGFHRVGFYSNVESSFAPPPQSGHRRVSIYVEKAFVGEQVPNQAELEDYTVAVIAELRQWGFLDEVDIVDPTWVPVAYTWSWPDSDWREQAIAALAQAGIEAVGRYARWHFQGIADSIRDGLAV